MSSGAESVADWRRLVDAPQGRAGPSTTRPLGHLAPGLLVMICGDVIRPSPPFLLASAGTRRNLAPEMARTRDPNGFAALARAVGAGAVGLQAGQQALTTIACILAAKGGLVAEVTVGDCIESLELARQIRGEAEGRAGSELFYQALRESRVLGDDARQRFEFSPGAASQPAHSSSTVTVSPVGRYATFSSTTWPSDSPRSTSRRCNASPTCSASCSGLISRPITRVSTR